MRSLWAFAARITTTMHISTGRFESTQSMHLFARLADPSGKARSEAANLCLFICLFVSIKPEKSYSASCVRREVNTLGVITHGHRHKPRAYQRQRHVSVFLCALELTALLSKKFTSASTAQEKSHSCWQQTVDVQ